MANGHNIWPTINNIGSLIHVAGRWGHTRTLLGAVLMLAHHLPRDSCWQEMRAKQDIGWCFMDVGPPSTTWFMLAGDEGKTEHCLMLYGCWPSIYHVIHVGGRWGHNRALVDALWMLVHHLPRDSCWQEMRAKQDIGWCCMDVGPPSTTWFMLAGDEGKTGHWLMLFGCWPTIYHVIHVGGRWGQNRTLLCAALMLAHHLPRDSWWREMRAKQDIGWCCMDVGPPSTTWFMLAGDEGKTEHWLMLSGCWPTIHHVIHVGRRWGQNRTLLCAALMLAHHLPRDSCWREMRAKQDIGWCCMDVSPPSTTWFMLAGDEGKTGHWLMLYGC